MADTFNLPAVGDTMVEGEIVEWFVAVGDEVALDQAICSIETDKSVVELTTPFRGTVLALGGAVGDVIEVGSAVIIVGQAGESIPTPAPQATSSSPPPADPVPYGSTTANGVPQNGAASTASPVVRKLAERHAVDLATVMGTGPAGRITRADVESAITNAVPAAPSVAARRSGPVLAMPKVRKAAREQEIDLTSLAGSGPRGSITIDDLGAGRQPQGERRERLSAMRRSIAAHLTTSAQEIPQFTSMVDVDASGLLALRKAIGEKLDSPVPVDAVLMALMIPVLRDHPITNAMLDGDEVVYFDRYDIGVAVDTADGLMVPVVKGAERRSVADLAAEILRLATAARDRTIQPAELSGGTCTVNNVGALGVLAGTPILPLGTSVIVAFGKARPVVQLRNGNPVEVPTLTVSATFDHRIIDGGDSGRFLAQLKQHLEVPALGLMA